MFVLPKEDDTKALEENESWRIFYLAPAVLMLLFLTSLLTCLRTEAPKFYLYERGQLKRARTAIHNIYRTGGSEYEATRIIKAFQD